MAIAPHGSFSISQEYHGLWTETIGFQNPKLSPVALESYPWPGYYSISPDGQWILRTQKTGSGDNIGILYRVAPNGKVSPLPGFNELLWKVSDAHARLKATDLYHTGINSGSWSKADDTLTLTLRGSNVHTSGDGIETVIVYNLKHKTATFIKSNSPVQ